MKKVVIIVLVLFLAATLTYAVGQQLRGNKSARLASEECPRFAERTEANVGESCPNDGEMLQKRLRNGSSESGKSFGEGRGYRKGLGTR